MASAIAISDIIAPPTLDDVRRLLLLFLANDQNPVTDWHSGAILRTMFELESVVIQDLVANTLPDVFANGYPDDAVGDSETLVAHGWYNLDRFLAGFAIQTITLACDATHGPILIAAGRLYRATDGSKYSGSSGGTLGTSSTLTIDVAATSPGAARGLVAELVDKVPGVTVQSAAIKIITGIGQFGSDQESDPALRARMDARFPDLDAFDPDEIDRITTWALAAGTTTTRVRPDPDTVYAGGIILTLANDSGGISGGEVTTVQDYIDARSFDLITAQAASNLTVDAGGTVFYPAAWDAAILAVQQAAADVAWDEALAANQIGGLLTLLTLKKAVMDQGAIDFMGLQLNGSPTDLSLGSTEVPVPGGSLSSQLTWNPY